MDGPDDIAGRLAACLARRLGPPGAVRGLMRLTGGATKTTWAFEADTGRGWERLILQQTVPETLLPGEATGGLPRVRGADDARLMQAAAAAGVPVPPVRLVLEEADGLGAGYVTGFVPGETIARRILRDDRFAAVRPRLAAQCGRILARIHALDPANLPPLKPLDAAAQLALYRAIFDSFDHPQPVVEYALRWIEAHLPPPAPLAVVHGDFRNGNLIVDETGIAAVLDWEIAQRGDPMQDLGWLCVRTWRFGGPQPVGGFGRCEDLFAAYEAESGRAVDPARVRFWEAFGCLKWSVMCMMKGQRYRFGAPRTLEASAIGRRMEESLWDFLDLTGRWPD